MCLMFCLHAEDARRIRTRLHISLHTLLRFRLLLQLLSFALLHLLSFALLHLLFFALALLPFVFLRRAIDAVRADGS